MSDLAPIIAELAARLGSAEGEPQPLDGGITNRNYRMCFGGTDYVIRVPGRDTALLGIDRGSEWAAAGMAARTGVGPPASAMLESPPCLVTGFIEGRPVPPEELCTPATLALVAAAVRSVHECGEDLPCAFDVLEIIQSYMHTAAERGADVPTGFDKACRQMFEIKRVLRGGEHDPVPCHNDLLAGNFIHDGDRMRIVDWEYAGMGDRYFDLGNFAVNNELDEAAEEALLEAYFGEPPTPRRLAALRLMRVASDLREAMWSLVQSEVSELDFDFMAYHRRHLRRAQETANQPQFARWMKESRVAPA